MILKFFGRKKALIYGRLTKTENISTVYYIEKVKDDTKNEPSQDPKSVVQCNKEEVKDES